VTAEERAALLCVDMRLLALLVLIAACGLACERLELSVREMLDQADLVFRGRIVSFRAAPMPDPSSPPNGASRGRLTLFPVTRVWKGEAGATFEMPAFDETSGGAGFSPSLLRVGEELSVYASRIREAGYLTDICGNHKRVRSGKRDFRELGSGRRPRRAGPSPGQSGGACRLDGPGPGGAPRRPGGGGPRPCPPEAR